MFRFEFCFKRAEYQCFDRGSALNVKNSNASTGVFNVSTGVFCLNVRISMLRPGFCFKHKEYKCFDRVFDLNVRNINVSSVDIWIVTKG